MAGSRLTQAVLPWLPGDAAEIAPGVGLLTLPEGGGQMWVHGMATFTWHAGDEAGRRLAAVQVTQLKAATQKQVASALGTDLATVWRWVSAYRENGLAGLPPARKAPGGRPTHPGTDRENQRPGRAGPGPGSDRAPVRRLDLRGPHRPGTHPGPPPHRRTGRKAARRRRHRRHRWR